MCATRLHKLFRLSKEQWVLLLQAAWLLPSIRLALALVPFKWLLNKISTDPGPGTTSPVPSLESIVWSVEAVSRRLPFGRTCLTKALAAKFLLDRRGYRSKLRIGVARGAAGQLEAHAWIERDSAIVIGGPRGAVDRYQPLLHTVTTQGFGA
jgi:hypothetical protein